MSAAQRIRVHVEELFLSAPKSHRTIELKEELIANLQDKLADLVAGGRDEETAYDIVISSIGDVDELIFSLQEQFILDPEVIELRRGRTAKFISIGVGMYVFGFVPFFLLLSYREVLAGLACMFLCWGIATSLIVYNALSRPKYSKTQDSIVEDFKEYTSVKKNDKQLRKSLNSIVWTTATFIFLGLGLVTRAWGVLWLIFILAAVVEKIIALSLIKEE
ncbi:MAG: permease prefix domain 1-containing protein [Oscillospiraceae bacterium]|nr:permease prefix domain 1-containing protein [Oscillospiraceae bacterium]